MAEPKAKTLQMKLGFFDEDLKKPMHDDILKWINDNSEDFVYNIFPNLIDWNSTKIENLKKYCNSIIDSNLESIDLQIEKNIERINELKNNIEESHKEYYQNLIQEKIDENRILNEKKSLVSSSLNLGELPKRSRIKIIDRNWEFPVTSQSRSTTGYVSSKNLIGFVDLKLTFEYTTLSVTGIDFVNKVVIDKINWKEVDTEIDYKTGYDYGDKCKHSFLIEVKTEIKSLGELFRQLQTYKTYLSGDFVVVCPDDTEKKIIEEQGFKFVKYN